MNVEYAYNVSKIYMLLKYYASIVYSFIFISCDECK